MRIKRKLKGKIFFKSYRFNLFLSKNSLRSYRYYYEYITQVELKSIRA
jgi:hypothetical protein